MKKFLLLFILTSLFSIAVQAQNYTVVGGEISYAFLGASGQNGNNHQYELKMNIYTQCKDDSLGDIYFTISSPNHSYKPYKIKADVKDMGEVTLLPMPDGWSTTCNSTGNNLFMGIRKWQATANVTLIVGNNCEYNFSWTGGHRANVISGSSAQPFALKAYLNACKYTGESSPEFINKPFFFFGRQMCFTKYNTLKKLNQGGNVSLKYELTSALTSDSTDFDYKLGYGAKTPFRFRGYPSDSSNIISCYGLNFDSTTGTLSAQSNSDDTFMVAIKLTKYIDGNLVSSIMREITFQKMEMSDNRSPVITGINGTANTIDTFYVGEEKCLTFGTFDPDRDDSVKVVGYNFSVPNAHIYAEQDKKWPRIYFCFNPTIYDIGDATFDIIVRDVNLDIEDLFPSKYASKSFKFVIIGSPSNISTATFTKIRIYPQPCNNLLRLDNINEIGDAALRVTTILGKTISVNYLKNANSIEINTENLPSGVYYGTLTGKQSTKSFSFIVQH